MSPVSLLDRATANEVGVADRDGVKISWRLYGNGPDTILFVPTWNFVDSRVLRHQVDGLRDRFRVITYDARGSGESDRPKSGYSFDDHAMDALSVLDATNTPVASVVGASFGTHVAVLLAARHPGRIRRVALIAPPMEVPGTDSASANADDDDSGPDWRTDYDRFVPWFISAVFPEPNSERTIQEIIAIAREADHGVLLQQTTELDWDEAPSHLGEVRCPTLVIHGSADRTLELSSIKAVAAAMPDAQLMLLDGLGHRPDIRRPDIVNRVLSDFIRGQVTPFGVATIAG